MATLLIPFNPIATPRPRFRAIPGRGGQAYYPPTYKAWQKKVKDHLSSMLNPPEKLSGPICVEVNMCAKRPKTTTLHAPKWDVDNGAKAVLDALTGYAWNDDSQVVTLLASKEWAHEDSQGFIEINYAKAPSQSWYKRVVGRMMMYIDHICRQEDLAIDPQ